MISSENNYHFK